MRAAFTVHAPGTSALRALNYSPFLEAFRKPRKGHHSLRLGDELTSMGPAYGSVFTRLDCQTVYGVELVSQSDMFASEPAGRVIRRDSMPRPDKHQVQRWQILIAGAGTLGETEFYGHSLIADSRLTGKFVGPHAMVLTFTQPGSVNNLYVSAFLCSQIGIQLVRSTSYGTKILSLRKDALSDLHIPDPEQSMKDTIASLVRTSVEQREKYLRELHAARGVLEQLPAMQEAIEECGERKARSVVANGPFITLSARSHASLGDAQKHLVRQWKTRLCDLLEPEGIYNGPRFARVSCQKPFGINFLDQKDIFAIRPIPRRIVEPRISKRLLYVPQHALVVASHGQLSEGSLFGHVETASFGLHKCGITQDILRIIPKPEHHDLLLAFLSSRVGFHLLKSTAIGTSIPMMHTGLLSALPYPPLDRSMTRAVSGHIQASVSARTAADEAESEAVRLIEQEVLPSWLG